MDIYELYKSGLSIPEISNLPYISISKSTIMRKLKEKDLLRSRGDGIKLAGERGRLSHLKGVSRVFTKQHCESISKAKLGVGKGFSLKPNGYFVCTIGVDKGKSMHTIIMQNHIGRELTKDECVHHIDENKQNNDITNLQLMTRSAHQKYHINKRNKEKGSIK